VAREQAGHLSEPKAQILIDALVLSLRAVRVEQLSIPVVVQRFFVHAGLRSVRQPD
jgi:hypothetical protein